MAESDREVSINRLIAKDAITNALYTYGRGVDRVDADLIRSVFHPDAIADYGTMYRGTGYGFAEFIHEVHTPLQSHTHHLSNISITVDGDLAGSECYVLARLRSIDADGRIHDIVTHGRYVDDWERRDGVWRIAHRQYLHALDEVWEVRSATYGPTGSRDLDDPSYDALTPRRIEPTE